MPALKPVTARVTGVADVPVTGLCAAAVVVVPEVRSDTVLYTNLTVLDAPFAFTEPLSVAAVIVTDVAAFVVTDGAAMPVTLVVLLLPVRMVGLVSPA